MSGRWSPLVTGPLAVCKQGKGILMTELLSSQVVHCCPAKVLNKAHLSNSIEPGLPRVSLNTYFLATAPSFSVEKMIERTSDL